MAMSIRVEFYGIPRHRAGVAETLVDIDGESARLGSVLALLGSRYPQFAKDCLQGERLQPTVAANVSGRRFVSDPDASIQSGNALLLLSADGGG